jgi:hypothetical protein
MTKHGIRMKGGDEVEGLRALEEASALAPWCACLAEAEVQQAGSEKPFEGKRPANL